VANQNSTTVAVVGAGIMGAGIAQVAATSGYPVKLGDVSETALLKAHDTIEGSLRRLVKAAKLTEAQAQAATNRVHMTRSVDEAVDGAHVVIEAVSEVLDLKRNVLSNAAARAHPDALLGTNTSQLSITSIGADLGGAAERLIGTHFFNPPVIMGLVELILGLKTTEATLHRTREFATSLGKEVVVCRKDSPGFLTSRAYAIFRLECLRMIEEGLATPEDIDKAFRLGFNLPMGPLELGDFNGLDTFLHVLESLSEAYGERFRPTPGLRNLVAAGHLGRKAGRGFYTYDADGKRVKPESV
jgi:3-hydroxybutyryl-CoA dehydrogenase